MGEEQTSLRSILMLPWLANGHVYPFLELAKKLSTNFHVYFCSTKIILDSIATKNNGHDSTSITLIELHLPSLPDLPPQYHTTKNIPDLPLLLPTLIRAFQMSSSGFSEIITALKPDLLIYDVFQPWSAKMASSRGIPAVHFHITGSTSASFLHHAHTHKNYHNYPHLDSVNLTENEIREIEKMELWLKGDMLKLFKDEGGYSFGIYDQSHEIVLLKSCRGIEGKYIDHLETLCGKTILPTGPLVTFQQDEGGSEIMEWLSERKEHSTLYISFGSENYFSRDQMVEIAKGLDQVSDVNFIWAARSPVGSEIVLEEVLPLGFLERVGERGMIVQGWVPQAAILGHSSVGGFMSHCGWSAVIESVYFGVPMVATPLKFDQPINAKLVSEIGVGVEVVRDGDGVFNGKEVAKAVKEVFGKESGEGFRRIAREMSEKMKMEEDGAIIEVVKELSRICLKK